MKNHFKKMLSSIWLPDQISYLDDRQYLHTKANKDVLDAVNRNFSFFEFSENFVKDTVYVNIMKHAHDDEDLKDLLIAQVLHESVHNQAFQYAKNQLGINPSKLEPDQNLINQVYKNPTIDIEQPEIAGLLLFFAVEGILFFSGFSEILGLAQNGKMNGINDLFTYILRDETMHIQNGVYYMRHIFRKKKIDFDQLEKNAKIIFSAAVECLFNFYPDNKDQWYAYYIMHKRMAQLEALCPQGSEKRVHLKQFQNLVLPSNLSYMENKTDLPVNTNFFERKNTTYRLGGLS